MEASVTLDLKKLDIPFYAAYFPTALPVEVRGGEVEGSLLLEPLTVSSRVSLTGLLLEAAYPYLASLLTAPAGGRADFSAELAFSGEKGLTMDQALLRLKGSGCRSGQRIPSACRWR